jgi:hypothetical protein
MTSGSAGSLAPVTEADCAECAKKTVSANPVDIATGQKVLFRGESADEQRAREVSLPDDDAGVQSAG